MMSSKKIVISFGTRPEIIKLFPVIKELEKTDNEVILISTGQHSDLLRQTLDVLDIVPDYDFSVSLPNQSLPYVVSSVLASIEKALVKEKPDLLAVQGDTGSALAAALGGFYCNVPVAHVEAGLRTFDMTQPFPEEANRQMIDAISSLLFAPTDEAASNLGEVQGKVFVTGNTEIDALFFALDHCEPQKRFLCDEDIVLVTAHRRENFGHKMKQIAEAIEMLGKWHNGIKILVTVHPNLNVVKALSKIKGQKIEVLAPLDYVSFTHLLARSKIVLTDSGGLQEAAAALGIPALVLRDKTERVEGIATGAAKLVGTGVNSIVDNTVRLLEDKALYEKMAKSENPYGDGNAAKKIVEIIMKEYDLN